MHHIVFGGIYRDDKQCFFYAVPDRTSEMLFNVIKECIEPKTTIISDMWKYYSGIEIIPDMNFIHYTVNDSHNFVDPIIGAHTQHVEFLWASAKRCNRKECGMNRDLFYSYLYEFLWLKLFEGIDLYQQIIEDIKVFWPPEV